MYCESSYRKTGEKGRGRRKEEGKKTTEVVRSGRQINPSSWSSIAKKSKYPRYVSSRDEMIASRERAFGHLGFKKVPRPHPDPHPCLQLAEEALNYFNQYSPQKYKLLELGSFTFAQFGHFAIYHINFTAQNTHVAAAPEEMFFTELTYFTRVSVRLCVSLGPKNSLSGEKLNGCYFCRQNNKVWHPTSGGFVRGADRWYKTVQDICDINQNNAIPDHEKRLPRLKQVYRSLEPKKECENVSQQVDDAGLYAIEALKMYNEGWHIHYELVNPGFVTRVILPTCLLFHVNFTAKDTDDATAPEEIFFAEVTSTSGVLSCELCVLLEPEELISEDETVDKTNGCYYCHEFNNVPHPRVPGGFVRGGDSLYVSEKELEETALT